MKIQHVEAVFPGDHDPFFFLSRKAAKSQRKIAKRLCVFAALRERCLFQWNKNRINVLSQCQPIFISPPPRWTPSGSMLMNNVVCIITFVVMAGITREGEFFKAIPPLWFF
jgi:hypothetical protein